MYNKKKWIWQHKEYPFFKYRVKEFIPKLTLIAENDGEFKGGLTSKKYVAMTKVSIATAKRDIQELVKYGCIYKIEGLQGRNIKYAIKIL